MLKVIDHLLVHENHCLKLEAENWLFHSLLRGDCGRIMEPLLLILFDRKTARIGISYAKIQQHLQCDNAQVVDMQNNSVVYAICSVYGSALTYHLVKNTKNSFPYLDNLCNAKGSEDSGIIMTTGGQSLTEGDSSDSDPCMSNAETVVVKENSLDSTSASFDAVSVSSSTKNLPCQEYVKKLPYVQNISVFVNRGDETSPSLDDSTETLQSMMNGEYTNDNVENSDSCSVYSGNSLPLVKERLSKSESKINERVNSYSSLKDAVTSSESSQMAEVHSSSRIAISRAFHSSNAVDNDSSGTSSNDTDLPRSSSFSASETSTDSMSNCKIRKNIFPSSVTNGGSSNIIAKAIVEDIMTQIVDNVVKKPVIIQFFFQFLYSSGRI